VQVSVRISKESSMTSKYPFLSYASTFILNHAEKAQARGVKQDDFLMYLQERRNLELLASFHRVLRVHDGHFKCTESLTPLCFFVLHDCGELVEYTLSREETDINASGGHHGSTLQAASALDRRGILKVLLKKGADVNASGGYY